MDRRDFNAKFKSATSDEVRISLLDSYAEELSDKDNYSEAINLYTQALKLEKQKNAQAYFSGQIGICCFNLGNDKEALKNLLRSARLFEPGKPEFMRDMCGYVQFHLGSLYEYHGKTSKSLEARKACEQYVDSQEKDTQWMLYAGLSRNYESLGMHNEAIQYSQKAIQILSDNDPGLSYLYESMANNYMGLRQYHEAIKHFSKVLELDPNFERLDEIHLKSADCYLQLANYKMAAEVYEKLLEFNQIEGKKKDLLWLFIRIAECNFRLEEFEKSLLFTLEAMRRKPRNIPEKAEIRSYLTNNYYELSRYKEAVEEGEKTLKLAKRFPNDDLFYVRMALSYHNLGDKKSFSKYRTLYRKLFHEDNWTKYLDKLS